MRNLGGAVGLAVINTVLTDRSSLHSARLSEAVNWNNPEALRQLDLLAANLTARGLDGSTGALYQMANRVSAQATVMSFIDVFFLITTLFTGLAFAALLMKPPAKGAGANAH
jgi:DHA2 family multidrug resistance protein